MKKILSTMLLCAAILFASCSKEETSTVSVNSVNLNKSETDIMIGKTETLTATVLPENAENKSVTWTSSDQAVVTVNNGVIRGLKEGSATITATTADGGKTDACTVTVIETKIYVTGVTLDNQTLTVGTEREKKLIATVAPADATDKTVTWSSNDQTIATVNTEGVVRGVKIGSTRITATTNSGFKKATCTVTVVQGDLPVTNISIDYQTLSLVIDRKQILRTIITPSNATNVKISWSSSDNSIATIDSDGVVTAVKIGSATITASDENSKKTAKCEVTVTTPSIVGTWMTSGPSNTSLMMDFKQNRKYDIYINNSPFETGTYTVNMKTNELILTANKIRQTTSTHPPRTLTFQMTGATLTLLSGEVVYNNNPSWVSFPLTLGAR